tara:strand:- start:1255 stop:3558 length:2304 start_codon:yes stop_codon:yes gene_type:complete
MFKKIVIHNVGVLKAFDAGATPPLSPLTIFYARNGRGKSTLTAVMRAARDGCSSTVMARRSLGNNAADPEITLISDSGNRLFKGGKWQHQHAPIEVFDTTFIADNVFAGEMIELAQDRGLFSIIIGEEGVRLANLLERFNAYARTAASNLKSTESALNDDLPSEMTREAFFALAPNPSAYADRLDKAEKALKAVQQADKIALLKPLNTITAPVLPAYFDAVLSATVPDIDAAARVRLAEHFRVFKLGKQGEAWINYGKEHIHEDVCPFCSRPNADEFGMVTLYGQIFGEQYKAHMGTITVALTALDEALGEETLAAITATLAANTTSAKAWEQYLQIGGGLPDCSGLGPDLAKAHTGARTLLDRKRQSPLEVVEDAELLGEINEALSRAHATLGTYNAALDVINTATNVLQSASAMTEDDAKLAVTNAKRRIARTEDPGVQRRIEEYLAAYLRDERAKNARKVTQRRLKDTNEAAADHYHQRVNYYLERFGVSARITRPTNSMAGNAGSADYSLVIKGESIPRIRGRAIEPTPSFRNTLSTGDKTTLALAFFLAKLDHDGALKQKVVVFDDPLASHDSHRRGKTVEAIKELCGRCLQLIILSHDEYFLRDVEKRCASATIATYQMEYSDGDEWSAAKHVRLSDLCRSDHTKRLDKLAAFADSRAGDPDDIVLHVRQVIETHFRRSYTAYFSHNRNLGQMVRDIDNYAAPHPCAGVRDRMDALNSSTCDNHHGDDADVMPKKGVDPDALKVIVSDALELIGARRPLRS